MDPIDARRLRWKCRRGLLELDLVLDKARGEPIYLILAMTADGQLRMKPQNLLTGLPIRQLEAMS